MASLIVAIVSFFICHLGGIAAVILARSARHEIRASGGTQGGDGMATTGEVIGWIEIALSALLIVIAMFVIVGLIIIGNQTRNVFCNISTGLNN